MDTPNSPLDTLRQLKEMLDAGALTPTEFESLKQRLVFGEAPGAPPEAASEPGPLGATAAAYSPGPTAAAPAAYVPTSPESAVPELPTAGAAAFPEPDRLPEPEPSWPGNEFPGVAQEPARNPLALILSIGGVLVFLAVVAYLSFNRPPSEHISSTSQTAADSLAATIETGPQAAPLPATLAVPETVRVAPTNPAPPVRPRPMPAPRDSVAATIPAATIPAATADSAANQ